MTLSLRTSPQILKRRRRSQSPLLNLRLSALQWIIQSRRFPNIIIITMLVLLICSFTGHIYSYIQISIKDGGGDIGSHYLQSQFYGVSRQVTQKLRHQHKQHEEKRKKKKKKKKKKRQQQQLQQQQQIHHHQDQQRCSEKIQTPFYLQAKDIEKITYTKKDDYKKKRGFKVLVNGNQKVFHRRNFYDSCTFNPEEEQGNNGLIMNPIPVLFICSGRSGSSNTWLTLSKLAGGKIGVANEAFGSDPYQIKKFLNSMKSEEEGSWWLREHLCEVTKLNCNSAIAGIQWKPYANSWNSPSARGILKYIASHNKLHNDVGGIPKIRVLYMTRNPLDVLISRQKHKMVKANAHCKQGDAECLKNHSTYNMTLPTNDLIQKLQEMKYQDVKVESHLQTIGIDFYRTTYEKLYYSDDAEEWMTIFRYLGRGPTEGLQLDDIVSAFSLAKTTSQSIESLIMNYEAVKNVLAGTEFSHLLSSTINS